MIISHIIGGLGNQMFQYAVGRALAIAHQQPLLLDSSDFADYPLHQGFELTRVFNGAISTASKADIQNVLGWQANKRIKTRLTYPHWAIFRNRHFIVEPHFNYWAGIQQLPSSAYLFGYWQSERYFQDIAEVIRTDFAFKQPFSEKNTDLAQQISQVNAVSIHVRRGDYVQNPAAHAVHGVCSLAYYQTAILAITQLIEQPTFFVFSDDIEWVKTNLPLSFPCQYISHNQGIESYNDMRLMSLCQHHIIANSSFSWWGAWLNPNPTKIVIAPKKWFSIDNNINDLLPQEWISL